MRRATPYYQGCLQLEDPGENMHDLTPGGQLGAYRIQSIIGRGGMGVVYLADDEGLGRHVALKVLAPQFSADGSFRNRFERESRLAASLDHPNVVPVYEAGEIDGVLFIAMRYVAGPDLRTVLDSEGKFEVARAIGISAQLASALDAAHAHGLIHRDVKPGNVLLAAGYGSDGGEHVYLSDFGLTKRSASKSGLTQLGQLVGTIDYIAPEQITGTGVDGRADIYALGCVFYEMLAGQPPFMRETDLATMAAHLHEPPPSLTAVRPDLPPAADPLIAHVLAKDPNQRFSTAAEFVRAARAALVPDARQPTGEVGGRADPTIIAAAAVAAPIAGQDVVRSPTVLTDTNVPPGADGAPVAAGAATILNAPALPPPGSISGPPAAASGPPPGSAPPPPDTGAFASGGSVPPFFPTGAQGYPPPPPPPRSGRSVPMAVIAAAVGLVILLVAGVAFVIATAPHATPSLVAQVTPPGTLPVATATIATPAATPSSALTTPPATALPTTPAPSGTPASTSTPSVTPTASLQPPATPSSSPLPATELGKLLALLNTSVGTCTEDINKYNAVPITEALCPDGTYARRYARFASSADLDKAWNWFHITSTDNCNGFGNQTWTYNDYSPDLTRGRIACFTKSDIGSGFPQLMFTYDDLNLLGVIIGDSNATVTTLTDDWNANDGLVPPTQ